MIWRYAASFAVVGVVLPLLIASTAVAARFWFAGYDVGEPLIGPWFYHPLLVWQWATAWGFEEPHRALFVQGLLLAFVPTVLAGGSLGLRAVVEAQQRGRTTDAAGSMGTARELLRSNGIATRGDGVVLGRIGRAIVRVSDDMHVLVLGPSGSGKTVGPVVCTLLEHSGSMLVHDPKAELATITGRYRASLGPCHVFDPTSPYASTMNPLLELRGGDHLHGDCQMAATLIACSGLSKDPVWEEAAAELLTALMLVAFEHEKPTLGYVHDLVLEVSSDRLPKTKNAFAKRVFKAHEALESRVRSSVNFETRTAMAFMSDPVVRAATERSDFRAGDLFVGEQPTTVYVTCPPAQQERLRPLMRLVVQAVTNAALHSIGHLADGREKTRGALFLLDEFATLKRMDALELGLAVARGYGVRYQLVAQDLSQIAKVYGEKQSITANMGTIALMPGLSGSLRDVEEWGGWTMQPLRSRGRQVLKPLSAHSEEHEARIPLLNPAEMLNNTRQLLVFHLGCKPVWLDRVRYFDQRRYEGRWDKL